MAYKKHKKGLHERNPHNKRYDFPELIKSLPKLGDFVAKNKYDELSIDFANSDAVLTLNKALLAHFYVLKNGLFLMDIFVLQFLVGLIIFTILLTY